MRNTNADSANAAAHFRASYARLLSARRALDTNRTALLRLRYAWTVQGWQHIRVAFDRLPQLDSWFKIMTGPQGPDEIREALSRYGHEPTWETNYNSAINAHAGFLEDENRAARQLAEDASVILEVWGLDRLNEVALADGLAPHHVQHFLSFHEEQTVMETAAGRFGGRGALTDTSAVH